MSGRPLQFRVSTLLLVVFAFAATLSLWPRPATEVPLGLHEFVLPTGQRGLCGVEVVTRSPVVVESTLRKKADQLHRDVVIACQELSQREMEDPTLRELKYELSARINRLIGPARVDYVLIHRFEIRQRD